MRNQISEDELLINELIIRFDMKPRKCKKVNDSGIGSCQRIVCVSKDRFFFYSRMLDFTDLDFHKLQYVNPLAGVELKEIQKLKFPSRRTNERNYFTLTIPNNKILQFSKTSNGRVVDEFVQGTQEWTFLFDYDIVSLPEYEKRLEVMKMLEMEKLLKKRKKQEEEQMKKQEQINRKLQLEYESLVQIQKKQLQRQRQNEAQAEVKKQSEEFDCTDQMNFQQAYQKILNLEEGDQDLIKYETEMIEVIGKFKKKVESIVKRFIDELPFNINYGLDQKFVYKNYHIQIGSEKSLNLQFLESAKVADAIFSLKNKINSKIRIPLSAFIKYKGFKVLARALTPCDIMNDKEKEDKFLHGYFLDNWKTHFFLVDDLNIILQALNLKPYNAELYFQKVLVHLGPRVQLIETKQDPFEKARHSGDMRIGSEIKKSLIYVFNIAEVFPIDLDLEKNIKQDTVRLRPEYVVEYKQTGQQLTRLVGGALTYEYEDQEGVRDDYILARASQYLKYTHLVSFIKNLDSLKFVPMSSEELQTIMKQNGINMRYISAIYKLSSLPYIREVMTIEAAAREIKKIYRDYQKQYVIKIYRERYSEQISEIFSKESNNSLKQKRKKQLQRKEKQESVENAIDFLNLVFGNGQETEVLWDLIKKKVKQNYKINIQKYTDLSQGYLLTTVLYHCDFIVNLKSNIPIYNDPTPFLIKDWKDFKCRTSCFTFPSMQIYKFSKITPDLDKQKIIKRLENTLYLCRAFGNDENKHLAQLSIHLNEPALRPRQKFTTYNLKYEVANASKNNFENAYEICTFLLPSTHPFFQDLYLKYADLKTTDCVLLKKAAKNHAVRTLGMGHWKTSSILSNFKEQSYLQNLISGDMGVQANKKMELYHQITKEQAIVGKFMDCFNYVRKAIQLAESRSGKLSEEEVQYYFKVLMTGIQTTYKLRRIHDSLKISQFYWYALEEYRKDADCYQELESLLYFSLKGFLENSDFKYYLFKIVLILDEKLTTEQLQRKQVCLTNLRSRFRQSKTHINWIKEVLTKLIFALAQINDQPDFFSNFWKLVKKLGSEEFEEGLDEMKLLVRIYRKPYFEQALIDKFYVIEDSTWDAVKGNKG